MTVHSLDMDQHQRTPHITELSAPRLDRREPLAFRRRGYEAPALHPLPFAERFVEPQDRPLNIWEDYWALPKQALLVTAELAWGETETRASGPFQLDAALSVAQLRHVGACWRFGGDEVSVIPLPLDLLEACKVKELPRRRSTWPVLPVWAAEPFHEVAPGRFAALCVGHLGAVSELCGYLHEIGQTPAVFRVDVADMDADTARDIIRSRRPLPEQDARWTPPYHYNWEARDLTLVGSGHHPHSTGEGVT